MGVVLRFLDANVEFGIELFVRPALILTGVLMLLLSISLLKKDMKTQVSKTMLRSQDWYSHLCFLQSHMSNALALMIDKAANFSVDLVWQ